MGDENNEMVPPEICGLDHYNNGVCLLLPTCSCPAAGSAGGKSGESRRDGVGRIGTAGGPRPEDDRRPRLSRRG